MERRGFFGAIASALAGVGLVGCYEPKTQQVVQAVVKAQEVKLATDPWHYYEYLSPHRAGFKGYWYRENDEGYREIMAFECLDGTHVAAPTIARLEGFPSRKL